MAESNVRARVVKSSVSPTTKQIYKDDFEGLYGADVLEPPYNLTELKLMGEYSSILQQCIDAYKTNIVGFGIESEYKLDINSEEIQQAVKAQAEKENTRLGEFIRYLNLDESPELILGYVIDDREKTGNGYIEIIRDGMGLPVGIEYVDAQHMRVCKKTVPEEVEYKILENGVEKKVKRWKRFRRYVQMIDQEKVYFKEYGDPRIMNSTTGKFDESTPENLQATEIYHFKIGSGTYGKPRWLGNLISLYGARKAEELNLMYFTNGRHIPAAITVSNGQLDNTSYENLQAYMNDLSGTDNAHKFLLLEVQGIAEEKMQNGDEKITPAKVEIKSLAEVLQQDALFLEYDENTRQKIRSSFRLPPLYTGEAQEFSRATADTARKVTEEQVFQPERKTLARILNTLFLEPLEFSYVKLSIKGADFHDPIEIAKVLGPFIQAHAVAPNDLRPLLGQVLGKKIEFLPEEYDLPMTQMQNQSNVSDGLLDIMKSDQQQESLIDLLKDMRDVLESMQS
ncbi:phage portal protein [Sporosarcina sp. P37]|uniref:phage portal protein n=1 Tax=unclassified Sporosarcina TaxID=2647733 RepID=UPI000A17FA1E|nr:MULTISPECIES: phage portal protein [unclassified Sporosarcina]ARK23301.1 phage portal protein [Sporosarcina sp. P37]PID19553.1 phage portal protein [Sporosarcina sp. P35]